MSAAPDLSVLIVNFNGRGLLPDCLAAARAAAAGLTLEFVVADNGSSDGSLEYLGACPDVRLLPSPTNDGFARGMNRAAAAATGRAWLWLNPDCRLEPGTLAPALQALEARGGNVILGPRLRGEDGRPDPSALAFNTSFSAVMHVLAARRLRSFPILWRLAAFTGFKRGYAGSYLATQSDRPEAREVDWLSGACLLVSADAARRVGPLDEDFFMYSEDEAWCRRARELGVKCVWLPAWGALHIGRASRGGSPYIACHYYRSLWLYHRKFNPGGRRLVAAALLWMCLWRSLTETVRQVRGASDAALRRALWLSLAGWVLGGRDEPCGPVPPPPWPPRAGGSHAR